MGKIEFGIPFSGYSGTTFVSCFTSTYMFLEGVDLSAESDYDCKQLRGQPCDSCGNCAGGGSTPLNIQERYCFLFDTMCGRSALRLRFDGQPTEMQRMICTEGSDDDGGTAENIDFLFGYAGWDYRTVVDPAEWRASIESSIDLGRPVIARVGGEGEHFRVITGYDGDALLEPSYINAQNIQDRPAAYGDLEALYVFTERVAPRYTVKDGLERIRKVMKYNISENLWGGYADSMGLYSPGGLGGAGIDEKKRRMKRVADTMWYTFNCHNFAEVFRNLCEGRPILGGILEMEELRGPDFYPLWDKIGGPCYGYTHDLAWALIGLEGCADWSAHAAGYFGEMVELTISQLAKNDLDVLAAIEKAIELIK